MMFLLSKSFRSAIRFSIKFNAGSKANCESSFLYYAPYYAMVGIALMVFIVFEFAINGRYIPCWCLSNDFSSNTMLNVKNMVSFCTGKLFIFHDAISTLVGDRLIIINDLPFLLSPFFYCTAYLNLSLFFR